MLDSSAIEILLVEDNPTDLELALRTFKKYRIANRVEVARDGAAALDFIFGEGAHAARGSVQIPKVILLDLKLPKISGIEVLRRIKGDPRTKLVPVVILTSSREDRDLVESYQLGVNSYIVKPVDVDQFRDCLREIGMYWLLANSPPQIHASQ